MWDRKGSVSHWTGTSMSPKKKQRLPSQETTRATPAALSLSSAAAACPACRPALRRPRRLCAGGSPQAGSQQERRAPPRAAALLSLALLTLRRRTPALRPCAPLPRLLPGRPVRGALRRGGAEAAAGGGGRGLQPAAQEPLRCRLHAVQHSLSPLLAGLVSFFVLHLRIACVYVCVCVCVYVRVCVPLCCFASSSGCFCAWLFSDVSRAPLLPLLLLAAPSALRP